MTAIVSRISFPGFVTIENKDTSTHYVEIGTIEVEGKTLELELLRKKDLPEHFNFVLAKISIDDELVWSFQAVAGMEDFDGVGILAMAGDTPVIALVGKGREGRIEKVRTLASFVNNEPSGIRKRILLKEAAAEYLGRGFVLNDKERLVFSKDEAAAREAARQRNAAEDAQRAAEVAARQAQKQAKIDRLLARDVIFGFDAQGARRRGIPVTTSEWMVLPHGTTVILVESFDEETKTVGKLLEAFKIEKPRGQGAKKVGKAVVTPQPVLRGMVSASAPKPLRTVLMEIGDDVHDVQIYPSMETVQEARKAGLNGGTFVALDRVEQNGQVQVYKVFSDRVDTVGTFLPLG